MLRKLRYEINKPLIYTEELKKAYLGTSIVGNRLSGKTVLITGATGGLGMALAARFLAEGCNTIITGRNEEKLISEVNNLKNDVKGFIEYLVMDVCDSDSVDRAISAIEDKGYTLDILVNNAGVLTDNDKKKKFLNITSDEFLTVWNTNYIGTCYCTERVIDHYEKNNIFGNIINISSICSEFRNYQYTVYGMSKSAINKFSETLKQKHKNITITVIKPGTIATNMNNLKLCDDISSNCNGLHRAAMTEEIAALAAFAASGFGKYFINGITASACEVL